MVSMAGCNAVALRKAKWNRAQARKMQRSAAKLKFMTFVYFSNVLKGAMSSCKRRSFCWSNHVLMDRRRLHIRFVSEFDVDARHLPTHNLLG